MADVEGVTKLLTPRYGRFLIEHAAGISGLIGLFPKTDVEVKTSIDDSYVEEGKAALLLLGCYQIDQKMVILKTLLLVKEEHLEWKIDNVYPLDAETYNLDHVS